jgi:hypothetical protein
MQLLPIGECGYDGVEVEMLGGFQHAITMVG